MASPKNNKACKINRQAPVPGRRMTMVERAKIEALEAFGSEGFESLSIKKKDLRSKLELSQVMNSSSNQPRVLTRLEKAKLEAHSAFKDVKLGQIDLNTKKRKLQDCDPEKNSNIKHLSRLQKAKFEADKSFQDDSLETILKKRTKLESRNMPCQKMKDQDARNENDQKSAGEKLQRSENISSLKYLESTNKKPRLAKVAVEDRNIDKRTNRTLNRIDKAKLEVTESFKGEHLDEMCKESKKIVAKYLNPIKHTKRSQTNYIARSSKLRKTNGMKTTSNIDVYSSIHGDQNLNDPTVLMETSRKVVETAIGLETPDSSPMVLNK